jgi:hypothetical protein
LDLAADHGLAIFTYAAEPAPVVGNVA